MKQIDQNQLGKLVIHKTDGQSRVGEYFTAHGKFETPNFMPVGTQGTVKGVTPDDLTKLGAQIILSNTYHLHLRPGEKLIQQVGGLHKFMGWNGPILTDSGGFQIFSLAKLRKVSDEGVCFQSHVDGANLFLTPENVVEIQETLGVDIMMVLDECLGFPATRQQAEESLRLTLNWAKRAIKARQRPETLQFGIVQGGMFEDLRIRAATELAELPFDGYAIGGLSVGESTEIMAQYTEIAANALPKDKIRYLMGVGTPSDIVRSVRLGVDLFDCVIPTRSARFGRLYVENGFINIRNSQFKDDSGPIEDGCDCYTCQRFSKAYMAHLMRAKEALYVQLASIHNLRFYERLMERIRHAIREGTFQSFAESFLSNRVESGGECEQEE